MRKDSTVTATSNAARLTGMWAMTRNGLRLQSGVQQENEELLRRMDREQS
jgi:hypothetical protein